MKDNALTNGWLERRRRRHARERARAGPAGAHPRPTLTCAAPWRSTLPKQARPPPSFCPRGQRVPRGAWIGRPYGTAQSYAPHASPGERPTTPPLRGRHGRECKTQSNTTNGQATSITTVVRKTQIQGALASKPSRREEELRNDFHRRPNNTSYRRKHRFTNRCSHSTSSRHFLSIAYPTPHWMSY